MRSSKVDGAIAKINLANNPIILIRVNPSVYPLLRWKLLKHFKNLEVALISLNIPYYEIFSELKEKRVEVPKLFIIDGQSPGVAPSWLPSAFSQGLPTAKRTTYTGAPGSLTGLSIMMTRLFARTKFDLVILDSLSTLLIYNEPRQTERFVHFLIEKLRSSSTPGIFIALEGGPYSTEVEEITQFFDSVIQIHASA